MCKGALAVVVLAGVGIACVHAPVIMDAPSSIAVRATSAVAASGPAAEASTLRQVASLQKPHSTGSSEITALAESLDGSRLAWGDDNGTVSLYSFKNAKRSIVRDRKGATHDETDAIKDLAFDAKGQLWWRDAIGGVFCADLSAKEPKVKHVIVSSEFDLLFSNLLPSASVSTETQFSGFLGLRSKSFLKVVELPSKKTHQSDVVFPRQRGVNELIQHVVGSPDGKLLMAVSDGDAALLSLPDLKILRRLGQALGESAAFSPSSKLAALGTDGRGVFVWEAETGKAIKRISLPREAVIKSLVFVGENILYAADYPLLRIDLKTGSVDSVADVNACVLLLSRSGDRLFVGSHEGGLEVYALPPVDVPQKQLTPLPTSRGK